jgi:hypothetical protein
MRIKVRLREMAANEIAAMIPMAKINEIKAADPRPVFKAFVIGHEGEARGNVVGIGNVVKQWFRDAIQKLHDKIAAGIQLFHGHPAAGDTGPRTPIGEVVGKRLMRIGERLSSVVACYIYPAFRHLPLDVASIEADVQMEQKGKNVVIAEVDDVTGIALASSAVETPGFAGATLLGQLQAFAKNQHIDGGNLMDLTMEDVRTFLKSEKVKPSDVFGMEEMAADPIVRGLAEDRVRERIAGEFARRKDAEEKLEKIQKTHDDKVADLTKTINGLKTDTAKSRVGPLFETQRKGRKLDDRQTKFIQNRIGRFTPTNPDDVEKEFNAYLDSEIDEYNRIAKDVFGVETKPGNGGGGEKGEGDEPVPGAEPAEHHDAGTDNPYIDPAKNPMIRT